MGQLLINTSLFRSHAKMLLESSDDGPHVVWGATDCDP